MDSIFEMYFSASDIVSAFAWFLLLSFIAFYKSSQQLTVKLKKLYLYNFYFKLFFGLLFAISYLLVYGGGDTTAYWMSAMKIQDLFADSFEKGVQHLFDEPSLSNFRLYFNSRIGFPPSWIYFEPESYFVAKITFLLSLFTARSYLATTMIFSFIMAHANWKVYLIAVQSKLFNPKYLSLAMLFIPSVSFWCAGVSKDTILMICILVTCYTFYQLFIFKKKYSLKYWLLSLVTLWIISKTRSFILVTILLPFIVALIVHYYKRFHFSPISRFIITSFLIATIGLGSIILLGSSFATQLVSENSLVQEALIVQDDFSQNSTYGTKKYSIGEIDASPMGILKAIPISVFSGIFEPLPWKGLTSSLIINAMESLVLLMLFSKLVFSGKTLEWSRTIRKNEILVFMLAFILIIAFMAGFTSILYGVLVRIRAPLLPFLMCLLIINRDNLKKDNKQLLYSPLEK